jgi:hypothetical protein
MDHYLLMKLCIAVVVYWHSYLQAIQPVVSESLLSFLDSLMYFPFVQVW